MVTIDDPFVGYYQAGKMIALANYACKYFLGIHEPVDYVLPLDADELLTACDSSINLSDAVNLCIQDGHAVIYFRLCDMSADLGVSYSAENSLDSVFNHPYKGNLELFRGDMLTKVMIRSDCIDKIVQGNHTLDNKSYSFSFDDIQMGAQFGLYLSHLNLRGLKQLKSKVINGGESLKAADKLDVGNGLHWRNRYDSYMEGGDFYIRTLYESYQNNIINSKPLTATEIMQIIPSRLFKLSPAIISMDAS